MIRPMWPDFCLVLPFFFRPPPSRISTQLAQEMVFPPCRHYILGALDSRFRAFVTSLQQRLDVRLKDGRLSPASIVLLYLLYCIRTLALFRFLPPSLPLPSIQSRCWMSVSPAALGLEAIPRPPLWRQRMHSVDLRRSLSVLHIKTGVWYGTRPLALACFCFPLCVVCVSLFVCLKVQVGSVVDVGRLRFEHTPLYEVLTYKRRYW